MIGYKLARVINILALVLFLKVSYVEVFCSTRGKLFHEHLYKVCHVDISAIWGGVFRE